MSKETKNITEQDLEAMGLPRALLSFDRELLEADVRTKVRRLCERLPGRLGTGCVLVIGGDKGVGKSTVCCALCISARKLRQSVYYTTLRDWVDGLTKGAHYSDRETESARARTVDFLVIDDCTGDFLVRVTSFADQLTALVASRAAEGKVTVVVADVSPTNPVLTWPGGGMLHCVGFKMTGRNLHRDKSKQLAVTLMGD